MARTAHETRRREQTRLPTRSGRSRCVQRRSRSAPPALHRAARPAAPREAACSSRPCAASADPGHAPEALESTGSAQSNRDAPSSTRAAAAPRRRRRARPRVQRRRTRPRCRLPIWCPAWQVRLRALPAPSALAARLCGALASRACAAASRGARARVWTRCHVIAPQKVAPSERIAPFEASWRPWPPLCTASQRRHAAERTPPVASLRAARAACARCRRRPPRPPLRLRRRCGVARPRCAPRVPPARAATPTAPPVLRQPPRQRMRRTPPPAPASSPRCWRCCARAAPRPAPRRASRAACTWWARGRATRASLPFPRCD